MMILSSIKLLIPTLVGLLCLHFARFSTASYDNERQIYIVYMGELPAEQTISLTDVHHSLLSDIIGDETIARKSKLHSYGRSFNAFAARLLPREAELLSKKEGVVSVFKNRKLKLFTTRTWDFLGMSEKIKRNHQMESNIIVALIDTGIWTESPSFNDKGFGPPPSKWKGKCVTGANFTGCNNKVIGAQYFNIGESAPPDEATPADTEGHGTHTASTATGVAVASASLYGLGEGTARGAVPSARVASYKVCWGYGCMDVDMLAAFDAAIADGVDIISVSIGGSVRSFTEDSIGIGSFHALKKGILTVCAGGNDGPYLGSISNVGPWIMTVAASTVDRRFETNVELGNGDKISGIAINTFAPKKGLYPLTSGALAKNNETFGNSSACDYGTLDKEKVKGKIVYCKGAGGDYVVKELGGAGTVMSNDQDMDTAYATGSSASYVTIKDGLKIEKYINSTKSAQGVVYKTKIVNTTAPFIASFSSRGPQTLISNILKPDIAAPGVNILAAISKFTTVVGHENDKKTSIFNFNSGTSMACPHVAGAAAYVKSFHPMWSHAAIKSALMTTSKPIKVKEGGELASGSGQINPKMAVHPGLIYDINTTSYVGLLCKQGYKDKEIALITGSGKYNCSKIQRGKGADGINYPSINLQVKNRESNISAVFYRRVTNVGVGKSVYKARVESPKGVSVKVVPDILLFSRPDQKRSFKVTLKGKFVDEDSRYLSGSLVWSDTKHEVRSPILVSLPIS
ncbi:hypothetical protein ACP275_12G151800 [Erythranthe tilingii]